MSLSFLAYLIPVLLVVYEYYYLEPRRRRFAFRERVYGFASCVAASEVGGGIFLGDFMELVDANIQRVNKPQNSNDPLYGTSAPEFALMLLIFYAQREGLDRLCQYCEDLRLGVERLRVYGTSRSF